MHLTSRLYALRADNTCSWRFYARSRISCCAFTVKGRRTLVGAGRILLSISFVLYKWRASRAHIHSHILFIVILYIFIYMCMYVCVLCAFICLLSLKFSLFSLLCQATFAYTWAKRFVLLFFLFFVNSSPSCLVFNFASLSAAIYCYNIICFFFLVIFASIHSLVGCFDLEAPVRPSTARITSECRPLVNSSMAVPSSWNGSSMPTRSCLRTCFACACCTGSILNL